MSRAIPQMWCKSSCSLLMLASPGEARVPLERKKQAATFVCSVRHLRVPRNHWTVALGSRRFSADFANLEEYTLEGNARLYEINYPRNRAS